jgi:hypothetical protein
LVLYTTRKIKVVPSYIEVPDRQKHNDRTTLKVINDGEEKVMDYDISINYSRHNSVDLEECSF